MLKSAKYFFLIFIITTIIPLMLMFIWMNTRFESMMHFNAASISEVGKKEFNSILDAYIEHQENKLLVKTREIDLKKTSQDDLKKILSVDYVEIIQRKHPRKVYSYYVLKKNNSDSIKKKLFIVTVVPLDNQSGTSLRVFKEINFSELNYFAPFNIELYEKGQISQNNFLGQVNIHRPPPPPVFGGTPPPPPEAEKPSYRNSKAQFAKIPLLGANKELVAVFTISHLGMPKPPEIRFFENNFGLAIFIAGFLLSILTAFYIRKNFIVPLMQLSDASQKVQEGNYDINLKTNLKHDEIKQTFLNFNRMCKDLKEKEELRKNFILNLTHDLRTPLIAQERSISMFTECFRKIGLKDELELSVSLEKSNRHLLRMVNLILESYKFNKEKIKLAPQQINLFELVNNSYENLKSLALEKHITLQNLLPVDFPLIIFDETCIKRVFINLISNSIDNLSYGGFVKIYGETNDNFVNIFVEDNGCGIAKADIEHIFDNFFSGKSLERKLGSGLGLSVCKKLIDLHNGTISVESEINLYTRFTIKLPMGEKICH